MTPASILAFLERHCHCLQIQYVPPSRRRLKNRIILQYRHHDELRTVGGTTIREAVQRASVRMSFTPPSPSPAEVPVFRAETRTIESPDPAEGVTTRGLLRGRYDVPEFES